MIKPTSTLFLAAFWLAACAPAADDSSPEVRQMTEPAIQVEGLRIERLDPRLDDLLDVDAQIEVLAEGFEWAEGPVWVPEGDHGYLLFSDVPNNRIHKWSDADGISIWLEPSGYTGAAEPSYEEGSNGLTLDSNGILVLAQHGDRRVARLSAPLSSPTPEFETVVATWQGKRFNSPNDLVYDREGNLYFTDPPYGLDGGADDPAKEIPFSGVYRLSTDGSLDLLDDQTRFPNGIALSPEQSTLYVTNSDPDNRLLLAYDIAGDGTVSGRRILVDMTALGEGGPDGLKVDHHGNVWTSAPGGVRIFSADGAALGAIHIGPCANLGWGDDGATVYMTADSYLMRVRTKLDPALN